MQKATHCHLFYCYRYLEQIAQMESTCGKQDPDLKRLIGKKGAFIISLKGSELTRL